ncbi:MAG: CBS domain-containing protein [Gammaproteobacteria bacterium]|nr:CBS domain-containing protein [Gammaproteobacteria bacterium]
MVFYIYNQGIRQEESLSRLLNEQQAKKVQRTARTRKVAKKTRDHKGDIGTATYKETSEEAFRQPILFAHQVMSAPVFTLSDQSFLHDAWQAFQDNAFHHIPIVNAQKQLAGVISDSDVLHYSSAFNPRATRNPQSERILAIIKTPVISVSTQTPIRELADLMVNRHIGCLPVVDDTHKVEGIVTRTDILRALVKDAPIELWT